MNLDFAWYNGIDVSAMVEQVQQVLYPLGQPPQLNPNLNPAVTAQVPPTFTTQIQNITNWWNLQRTQAARNTVIDAFVYQALALAPASIIVSRGEFIAENNTRLGNGAISYLLSAVNAESTTPIYSPSVVIEGQKSIVPVPPGGMELIPVGQNQVMAEMVTLWQVQQASVNRGVLTDGQYWVFYEIAFAATQFTFNSSVPYDAGTQNGTASVLGLLSKFFVNFTSASSLLKP